MTDAGTGSLTDAEVETANTDTSGAVIVIIVIIILAVIAAVLVCIFRKRLNLEGLSLIHI